MSHVRLLVVLLLPLPAPEGEKAGVGLQAPVLRHCSLLLAGALLPTWSASR